MTLDGFLEVSRFGVETAMVVSAPVLILGLLAGIGVSIVQAATQINDASLAFIPKITAVVLALMVCGPWMISRMAAFAEFAFNTIPLVTQ